MSPGWNRNRGCARCTAILAGVQSQPSMRTSGSARNASRKVASDEAAATEQGDGRHGVEVSKVARRYRFQGQGHVAQMFVDFARGTRWPPAENTFRTLLGGRRPGLAHRLPLVSPHRLGHLVAPGIGQADVGRHGVPPRDPFCQSSLGAPWADLHWGFQILAYAAWKLGGAQALVAGKCLALAGALGFALRPHLDRRTLPWLVPLAAFGLYHARFFIDVRPLALTLLCLGLQYWAVAAHLNGALRRPWLDPDPGAGGFGQPPGPLSLGGFARLLSAGRGIRGPSAAGFVRRLGNRIAPAHASKAVRCPNPSLRPLALTCARHVAVRAHQSLRLAWVHPAARLAGPHRPGILQHLFLPDRREPAPIRPAAERSGRGPAVSGLWSRGGAHLFPERIAPEPGPRVTVPGLFGLGLDGAAQPSLVGSGGIDGGGP